MTKQALRYRYKNRYTGPSKAGKKPSRSQRRVRRPLAVRVVTFQPYTTQRLFCVLDSSIFAQFKARLLKLIREHKGVDISNYEFTNYIVAAYTHATLAKEDKDSKTLVYPATRGFAACGILPFKPPTAEHAMFKPHEAYRKERDEAAAQRGEVVDVKPSIYAMSSDEKKTYVDDLKHHGLKASLSQAVSAAPPKQARKEGRAQFLTAAHVLARRRQLRRPQRTPRRLAWRPPAASRRPTRRRAAASPPRSSRSC